MMFCSNCGTKLGDDDKFCVNCGMRVEQPDGNQQENTAEETAVQTGAEEKVEEETQTEEIQTEDAQAEETQAEEAQTEMVATKESDGEKTSTEESTTEETAVQAETEEVSAKEKVSLEKKEETSQSDGYQINTGASQSEGYQINSGTSQSDGYQINTGANQTGPVQQAAPLSSKTKKQLAAIAVCILIVIAAAVAVMKIIIFPGYKVPVKNLTKAINKQKEKYVEDNIPKAYKALKETANMDYDELFTYSITKANQDFAYDDIKKAEYKITEKKKVSEKRAKAIRNQLRDSIDSDKKISFDTKKCYALAVEFKLDNGDDKETFETVVYTAKSDGKWMLLAVKNVDLDDDESEE